MHESGALTFHIADKKEAEFFHKLEEFNLTEWNQKLDHDMAAICEANQFFKAEHQQWGHRPGVNSGNGQLEARIPARLHAMFLKKDPDYLNNDKTWNEFIGMFPRLRVMNS